MPWLESVYESYKDKGLNIVGLTTVSRSSTDDEVRRFLRDNRISYPVFKENGSAREYLNMTGTPFITLVQDGKLVWEHRLPTEQFPLQLFEQLASAHKSAGE